MTRWDGATSDARRPLAARHCRDAELPEIGSHDVRRSYATTDLANAAGWYDTALAIYGLTDAMPPAIHLTAPRRFRSQRPGVTVHTAPLDDNEPTERAGVPVTTIGRTILDTLERSGPELATQAAEQALDQGLVTRRRLRAALEAHGEALQPLADLTAVSS